MRADWAEITGWRPSTPWILHGLSLLGFGIWEISQRGNQAINSGVDYVFLYFLKNKKRKAIYSLFDLSANINILGLFLYIIKLIKKKSLYNLFYF